MSSSANELPTLPEKQIQPFIVQCPILYLGTAVPTSSADPLESVQQPLANRYPIDGTNIVKGIDGILSIYENGIQLTFVRHPFVAIFYPLSSLIYCGALRFTHVQNPQRSTVDWRFLPLDSETSKHPPIFCAVFQRTELVSSDECHCFITKNEREATILVETIGSIYRNLPEKSSFGKSPIFYQLDRFGRRISETMGVIYMTIDEQQNSSGSSSFDKEDFLDPLRPGFFYRSDESLIEKWHIWKDINSSTDRFQSRPRPPPSPFDEISIMESKQSRRKHRKRSKPISNFVERKEIHPLPIVIEKILPNAKIDQNYSSDVSEQDSDIIDTFFKDHRNRRTEINLESLQSILQHLDR